MKSKRKYLNREDLRRSRKYLTQLFADEGGDDQGTGAEAAGAEDDGKKKQPTYTDEDIDRIIAARFKRWQEQKDKEISEAKKLADMNAQQRAEHERDELKKELDALKGEKARSELIREARKTLSTGGINVEDELLAMLVGSDAESTKASVESFSKLFKAAVDAAVKDALKGGAPKGGAPSGGLTKDQILAVKDRAERQRLINENMDLFRAR